MSKLDHFIAHGKNVYITKASSLQRVSNFTQNIFIIYTPKADIGQCIPMALSKWKKLH